MKFRGLEIGRVTEVTPQDDQVRLTLAVDPARLAFDPRKCPRISGLHNSFRCQIRRLRRSPTTDGNSTCGPAPPSTPTTSPSRSTPSSQNLTGVLKQIEPEKLNETLSVGPPRSAATAVSNRRLPRHLRRPGRPAAPRSARRPRRHRRNIRGGKGLRARHPAIMATLRNLSTTAKTLTDEQRNFDLMLTNVTGLATTGTTVVNTNAQAASRALDLLRPTTALFQTYSPALNCLIDGMDILLQKACPPWAAHRPASGSSVSFLQGVPLYGYPGNLPKVNAKGGPNCMGLPRIPVGTKAKYLVTDTGVNPFRGEPATSQWHTEDLMTMLLG